MFRPLLAATVEDLAKLRLPLLASPKLDGIRCIILEGEAKSRNLKPIRNTYVQACLAGLPEGVDGELVVGEPNVGQVFNRTTSGVMSEEGEPEFQLCAFDIAGLPWKFRNRLDALREVADHPAVSIVPHVLVRSLPELLAYEQRTLDEGYEGVMLRDPDGKYKMGRSTLNEGILMKLKRFSDGEAVVTGVEEGVHNLNGEARDPTGYMRRSTAKDNMMPSGRVGTVYADDCRTGEHVVLSPGRMTQAEREYYLRHPERIVGRVARYKSFDYGKVDVARFRTFQGFRDPGDMS